MGSAGVEVGMKPPDMVGLARFMGDVGFQRIRLVGIPYSVPEEVSREKTSPVNSGIVFEMRELSRLVRISSLNNLPSPELSRAIGRASR